MVRGPALQPLLDAVTADDPHAARWTGPGELTVTGHTPEQVGALAHALGVMLHGLAPAEQTLEESYLRLTASSVEHKAGAPA